MWLQLCVGGQSLLRIECEKGVIELDQAFSYRGQQLKIHTARHQETDINAGHHFAAEMDAFATAVMDDTDKDAGRRGTSRHDRHRSDRTLGARRKAIATGLNGGLIDLRRQQIPVNQADERFSCLV